MFQARKHDLLAGLLNLTRKKHLVENSIDLRLSDSPIVSLRTFPYLVEVEHKVQLADIAEELVQHFDEEVYSLQIREFVVVCVYTSAEEESSVTSVDDFRGAAEFDKVGLVFLVSRCNEAVYLDS